MAIRFPAVPDSITSEIFAVLICAACELGHTWPQPPDLTPYYANYYGGRHGVTSGLCDGRRLRLISSTLPRANGAKLLDVGCGEGTFLLAARRKGWSVAGIEINPTAARSAGLAVFEDLKDVSQCGPFDRITFWHTLEHVRDPLATLQEARKLLSPRGLVFIAVPDAGGWQARALGRHWLHLDAPRHLYHFNSRALGRLLQAAGLDSIQQWHQEFEYDLLGWSQSALNKILPRQNAFFRMLTGRRPVLSTAETVANCVLGPLLTGLAIPLVPLSALFRSGGTLVVAARNTTDSNILDSDPIH